MKMKEKIFEKIFYNKEKSISKIESRKKFSFSYEYKDYFQIIKLSILVPD